MRLQLHRTQRNGQTSFTSNGGVTRYTYTDGDDSYSVTFTRYRDLAVTRSIDDLLFTGELRIEHRRTGAVVDSYTDSASWELMYPGKTHISE